jgi:hypothetical protein
MEQFGDPFAPNRGDYAELGKVCPHRVDRSGLLADEQMACAVKHRATLLIACFGWHEPHLGSPDRLANSLCCVVLLALDAGLHLGWRHQSHDMTD